MSVEVISNGTDSVLIDDTSDVAFGPVMGRPADVVYAFLAWLDNDARLYTTDELTSQWAGYDERMEANGGYDE